ncbi:MAG: ABC transporter ATP-binding protein [Pseudomonadota bacterium]
MSDQSVLPQPALAPETSPAPVIVHLQGVTKRYAGQAAVDNVNLDIRAGEFFTMLGPSGSGKTTTLRLISGFERPDAGRIEIDGEDISGTPPFMRPVNTVFQDYALFPHLSVMENVIYGPLMHGASRPDAIKRAGEALEMVRLSQMAQRMPGQLSGGQRQRVAMARAVVNRPKVLLLDEPLGALDLKLRHEMQFELQRIQSELGITFIYVTHDQEEALTMSTRIAVFNHGAIRQIGGPRDLYEHPADAFVAGFVGVSNIITREGRKYILRPEKIELAIADPADASLVREPGVVREAHYLGMTMRYVVALDRGDVLTVAVVNGRETNETPPERGARVWASWAPKDVVEIKDEGERA